MQRLEGLLDGKLAVARDAMWMPVDHQVVYVIETEPLQAGVDALHYVLAREAALIGARAHRHRNLGCQDILIARGQLAKQCTDDLFALADSVDVGAVEVEQSLVQRRLEDGSGVVDAQSPVPLVPHAWLAEIHGAQAQLGHAQTTVLTQLNRLEHDRLLANYSPPSDRGCILTGSGLGLHSAAGCVPRIAPWISG